MIQKTLEMILDQSLYIHYPMQLRKNKKATIQALIDFGSKVNAMILAYVAKLGLKVCSTNVGAQKIDNSLFIIFEMVIAGFQMIEKLNRERFFQKTFLLANTSMNIVLKMLFLIFSNLDVQFANKELT